MARKFSSNWRTPKIRFQIEYMRLELVLITEI